MSGGPALTNWVEVEGVTIGCYSSKVQVDAEDLAVILRADWIAAVIEDQSPMVYCSSRCMIATITILLSSISYASPKTSQAAQGALGIIWSESGDHSIRYDGSAFRLTINGTNFWITAAHVAYDVAGRTPKLFLSPARLQLAGRFAPRTDPNYNSVKKRPEHFLVADSKDVLSSCERDFTLPYKRHQFKGTDICTVRGNINYAEKGALKLRDLKQQPLVHGEPLVFSGYPFDANGKLSRVSCNFQGYSAQFWDFRGLLFCTSIMDTVGYSGGPVMDQAGRVVGVLSADLATRFDKIDDEGHNRVNYFTPLLLRGSTIDGFNQDEIDDQECSSVRLIAGRVVLINGNSCKP